MFRKIFPPANEMTLFVITTTLLSMFFYMDGWLAGAYAVYIDVVDSIFQDAESVLENAFAVIQFVVIVPMIAASIFGPLALPFTRKDLRGLCFFMFSADLVLITTANVMLAIHDGSIIYLASSVYFFAWLTYVFILSSFEKEMLLFDADQAEAVPSCLAALISIVVVFVCIKVLSVYWVLAYMYGSIAVTVAFNVFDKAFGEGSASL